jgi:hypothetical protein
MKRGRLATTAVASMVAIMALSPCLTTIAYANTSNIPSSIAVAVAYADTEGRGSSAGTCADCFPTPWCGSPGVQFIGSSTNYNGNSTDTSNCKGGDWDTGAILVINRGTTPITLTNLTASFPLPSSGSSVTPTCAAEMRPITFNVWFGRQYYWHNPADPAFDGGPITVPAGGEAIFAGTSSDNSYRCPTGNYPSIGPTNGTYDFDTSDAYYLDGCAPTTDTSSAPRITFSADGYAATTYSDNGHTMDTGGIDAGNCAPTTADPQWGHESLGWRLVNGTCGESCPTNQPEVQALLSSAVVNTTVASPPSTTSSITTGPATGMSGGATASVVFVVATAVVVVAAAGFFALRRRKPAP